MPSDERAARAMEALAQPRETFRSAVAEAVEQVRTHLAHRQATDAERRDRAAEELGAFGAAWIDPARYATLLGSAEAPDAALRARLERALEVLSEAVTVGGSLFRVEVEPGGNVSREVAWSLACIGGIFGAAQTAELIRSGRFDLAEHADLLDVFPFHRWNRAERQIAPPLLVEVSGPDLQVAGLAEFLDGAQKLVLVVRGGAAPPAPLVRLITPGVLVMQTTDPAALDRLATYPGPAVAALMPEGAASFVHDPRGGRRLRDRLVVEHLPAAPPTTPLGRQSVSQMAQDLEQLRALAEEAPAPAPPDLPAAAAVPVPPVALPAAAGGEPADRLAAWLLEQAELG